METNSASSNKKKRKLSHAQRKEMLAEEIRLLESGVATLKTRGLPPEEMLLMDPVLLPIVEGKAGILYALQAQQLRVASIQSALSQCVLDQQFYPLYSRIHLTKDWNERRAALLAIREQKLQVALEFVNACANSSQSHFSENKFETEEGDLCCVRYETVDFPGVASLEQVFDALWFFMTNMEIVISEQLGQITLRDDYDTADGRAINTRFISNSSGLTTEGNVVTFRRMFDEGVDHFNGERCAVVAVDSIDEDELHPYISHERARRDASGAIVLTASRRPKESGATAPQHLRGDEEDELVVTMRRATFWKFYRPAFPLPELAIHDFHDGMTAWADVMVRTLRSKVYSSP